MKVKNVGARKGGEVVQVCLQDIEASTRVPRWKLVVLRNVSLAAEKSVTLEFSLGAQELQFIDEEGRPCLELGAFRLWVGGCSPSEGASTEGLQAVEFEFELVET